MTEARARVRLPVPRIDWFRVIVDLQYYGWSHGRIARALGRHKSWLATLKNTPGAEPRHNDGQSLIALWSSVTERPVEAIPIDTNPTLSAYRSQSVRNVDANRLDTPRVFPPQGTAPHVQAPAPERHPGADPGRHARADQRTGRQHRRGR